MRGRIPLVGFAILCLLLPAVPRLAGQESIGFDIFQPILARSAPRDWTQYGTSPQLNTALKAYETTPSIKTAIGVLQHFQQLKGNAAMRAALLELDPDLFTSVDIAKYEIVMQVRKQLKGAKSSRRIGSSGQRELAIIKWVRDARRAPGLRPVLDPQKQFCSDDDITNLTGELDPKADESVNGAHADRVFVEVSTRLGQALDPRTVDVQFLSPTKAFTVFRSKYGVSPPKPPDFLLAWTTSNPEKYNDPFGVYMLDAWAHEKGVTTENVQDPIHSTKPMSEVYGPPGNPPQHGKFAYIANNYRQIYTVHNGDFKSECKYLVRILDGWTAIDKSGVVLPEDWARKRDIAALVYRAGEDVPPAAELRGKAKAFIDDVVRTAHGHHLDRVAAQLRTAMTAVKLGPKDEVSLQRLGQANPQLLDDLDGLLLAYGNVPPDVQKSLLSQFEQRIRRGESSSDPNEVYESGVLRYVMEAVQDQTDLFRGDVVAFEKLRGEVGKRLKEHLETADLETFVTEVALGKPARKELRLVDGRIRRVDRQLGPQDVIRDIRYIHAVSVVCGWDSEKQARRVREYFEAKDPGTAIRMLQSVQEVFDSSKVRPLTVTYAGEDGKPVTREISPSGTSLGGALFKAAVKGADIWGQIQSGADLYDRLYRLHQGGLSRQQLGEAYATILTSSLSLYDIFKTEKMRSVPLQGILSQVALGSPGQLGTGVASPEAATALLRAAFTDLAVVYMPALGQAIVLWDLASWGYKEYSLSSSRSEIIEAMVENGVWEPDDSASSRKLPAGELPSLKGIRAGVGAAAAPVEFLARLGFKLRMIESQTEMEPRSLLLDIVHDGGYLESDPAVAPTVDSIRNIAGPWLQTLRLGVLPAKPRDWTGDALRQVGVVIARREDEVSPIGAGAVTVNPGMRGWWSNYWVGKTDPTDTQLRIVGFLVADFWVKQQLLMEKAVLPALAREAARRKRDRLEELEVTTGNYDFTQEIGKIDRSVEAVDARLWPRVARSADPFPGQDYEPEKDKPVLLYFQTSTSETRAMLAKIEAFLKDPAGTALSLMEPQIVRGNPVVSTLDRRGAEQRAVVLLKSLRTFADSLADGYEQVHQALDETTGMIKESGLDIAPFHVKFEPGAWAPQAFLEGSAGSRGDIKIARDYLSTYKDERTKIATDIGARYQAGAPVPKSFLDWLTQGVNTGSSPGHPLWPELTRLRYQIRKLKEMQPFAAEAAPAEIRSPLHRMSIRKGEPLEGIDEADWSRPAPVLGEYIKLMEEEYERLLGRLGDMFEMTLKADSVTPFIGQPVTLRADVKPGTGLTGGTPGTRGFPDYVKKFRWTVKNTKGEPVGSPEGTEAPEWTAKLVRAQLHTVQVEALDQAGNPVATSTTGVSPQPLSLVGEVTVADGDHDGQPIAIVAGGALRGEVSKPGSFSFGIDQFDEHAWASGAEAYASVSIDGRTYASTRGTIDANPPSGAVRVVGSLLLSLPSKVSVEIEIVDKAGLDVPGADAVFLLNGAEKGAGRSAQLWVRKNDTIAARVEFLPLDLTQKIPDQAFEGAPPRQATLRCELPILDAGHFTVSGRFVPSGADAAQTPIAGGEISSSVRPSAPVGAQGAFAFTNTRPLDLRAPVPFEASALVLDGARRMYRPKQDPITGQITGRSLDLGAIEVARHSILVKPIVVHLYDVTGTPLPGLAGGVSIGSSPVAGQDGVFVGEHLFTDAGSRVAIQGWYFLPDGRKCPAEAELSIEMLGGWKDPKPPAPYHFYLPFYLPGSLRITGSTSVQTAGQLQPAPELVTLEDPAHGVRYQRAINAPFDFVTASPVMADDRIVLTASAAAGNVTMRGSGTALAPREPGPANVGEIVLSAAGDAPPAAAPAAGREGLLDRIRGAIVACDFEQARASAVQLQQVSPDEPWLQGNLGMLERLSEIQRRMQVLISAASSAPAGGEAVTALLSMRDSVSTLAPCLAAQIEGLARNQDKPASQVPSWLESQGATNQGGAPAGTVPSWLTAGAGGAGSRTDPGDALNRARETLVRNSDDAERARLEEERTRLRQDIRRLQEDRRSAEERLGQTTPDAGDAREGDRSGSNTRRSGSPGRWRGVAGLLEGISTALLQSRLPGGNIGFPPGGTGPASGGPGGGSLEGTWEGIGTLQSSRQGRTLGKGATQVLWTRQKDVLFRITRSGQGYVLQLDTGASVNSRYANGSRVGFVAYDSMSVPEKVTFTLTFDFEVSGDVLTGTMRAEASDGTLAERTVRCTRAPRL